jgi:hypothetical protein
VPAGAVVAGAVAAGCPGPVADAGSAAVVDSASTAAISPRRAIRAVLLCVRMVGSLQASA